MHLCPDELIILSAAVRAGVAVAQCMGCLKLMLLERVLRPATEPTHSNEGYDWLNWHPDYVNERGQTVWFDEPGGG